MRKLTLAILLTLSINANASVYVMCHFNSFTIPHSNNPYPVTSNHNVVITNTNSLTRYYHVSYHILINKIDIHTESYDVAIQPNGTFTDNKIITSIQKFKNKINLDASCKTIITGFEKNEIAGGGNINIT
jgi:hypothetical protein